MSQYPDAKFLTSANKVEQFLPDTGSEVAFAGRSNSGKSSAINVIVNRRQFARTSKTPGLRREAAKGSDGRTEHPIAMILLSFVLYTGGLSS